MPLIVHLTDSAAMVYYFMALPLIVREASTVFKTDGLTDEKLTEYIAEFVMK